MLVVVVAVNLIEVVVVQDAMAAKTMEDLDVVVAVSNAIRGGIYHSIVGLMAHVPILVGLVKILHRDTIIMQRLIINVEAQLIIVHVLD